MNHRERMLAGLPYQPWTDGLDALVHKEACKLAAVREEHLAAAIIAQEKE